VVLVSWHLSVPHLRRGVYRRKCMYRAKPGILAGMRVDSMLSWSSHLHALELRLPHKPTRSANLVADPRCAAVKGELKLLIAMGYASLRQGQAENVVRGLVRCTEIIVEKPGICRTGSWWVQAFEDDPTFLANHQACLCHTYIQVRGILGIAPLSCHFKTELQPLLIKRGCVLDNLTSPIVGTPRFCTPRSGKDGYREAILGTPLEMKTSNHKATPIG